MRHSGGGGEDSHVAPPQGLAASPCQNGKTARTASGSHLEQPALGFAQLRIIKGRFTEDSAILAGTCLFNRAQ